MKIIHLLFFNMYLCSKTKKGGGTVAGSSWMRMSKCLHMFVCCLSIILLISYEFCNVYRNYRYRITGLYPGGTGTVTDTGGTGVVTGTGGTGVVPGSGGIVTGTGGTGVVPGSGGTLTGTGGTMTGGVCADTQSNCNTYDRTICTDAHYHDWVNQNCRKWCGKCGGSGTYIVPGTDGTGTGGTGTGGTGSGTYIVPGTVDTGTGGPGTVGPGTGGTGSGTYIVPGTGGTGTGVAPGGTGTVCADTQSDCNTYDRTICTDAHYHDWVNQNCRKWCGKCGGSGTYIVPGTGGTGTGGTGTGGTGSGTYIVPGTGGTGTGGIGTGGTGSTTTIVPGTGGTGTGVVLGGTGTGTGPMTGGTGTGTMPGGTMTGGTGGNCADKLPNCADYTQATCTNPDYATWVLNNCAHYCNKCGGTMTGTMPGTWTGTMTGTGGTGTGTMTGGTGTGTMTGGTGTGTMTGGTMTGTCTDAVQNCAMLNQASHICSDAGAQVYAKQNCARTCGLCGSMTGGTGTWTGTGTGTMTGTGTGTGTMTGTGTGTMTGSGSCKDAIANCKSYDPSVCTSADYKQWASQNCAATCHLCSSSMSGGGTMTGGTVTGTGGVMTGTGTGTGGAMTGSSSGCVYNSHLYRQGESWKDGCKFNCQCVDGSTGKYQCSQLCVQWQLPSQCHMSPPAPGKCCQTPSCPAGFNIQYPQGYTEQ